MLTGVLVLQLQVVLAGKITANRKMVVIMCIDVTIDEPAYNLNALTVVQLCLSANGQAKHPKAKQIHR